MNLKQYQQFYIEDEGHWYVSKIKQYTEPSIQLMAKGLYEFWQLLSANPEPKILDRYQQFKPLDIQSTFFESENKILKIDEHSKLFLSLLIMENDLVDLSQMKVRNPEKYQNFIDIALQFKKGANYAFFRKKYGEDFLTKELVVYYRNFKSWFSKFGFYTDDHKGLT